MGEISLNKIIDLIIKYQNSSGDVTERRISDIIPEGLDSINAFCHLRQERRTFRIEKIIYAVYPETAEVVENLYKLFALSNSTNGRERIISIVLPILPAIKALKFFSMQIRGFAKRERSHIVHFIRDVVDINGYCEDEINEFLKKLWCGDIYRYRDGDTSEYLGLLKEIPHSIMDQCQRVALLIAKGSGRKPIPHDLINRINENFRRL